MYSMNCNDIVDSSEDSLSKFYSGKTRSTAESRPESSKRDRTNSRFYKYLKRQRFYNAYLGAMKLNKKVFTFDMFKAKFPSKYKFNSFKLMCCLFICFLRSTS
jgi:hypothetical protein